MLRGIIESINYRQSSETTRELCRKLSCESKIRESRIYSLLKGKRAMSAEEMRVLFKLREMGVIRAIKSRV